jgi:flavin-dependent dehydrogenase
VGGGWGRWGRFDQQLNRTFATDKSHRNFGFKRHYLELRTANRELIELYAFEKGYVGVSAIEGGRTNICGLVHASRLAGHKGKWEAFIDEVRREEPHVDAMYARYEPAQETFLSSEPVIFRGRSAVEQGIFLVGDASGIIDPLTGSGMAMAIQSAVLAAPFVLDAIAGKRDERKYAAAHRAFFFSRIAWSRRVALLLSRPAMLDSALAVRPSGAIGTFLLRKTRAETEEILRRLRGSR